MLNKIGLKEIVVNSDRLMSKNGIKDSDKDEESMNKLIEYFKSKKVRKNEYEIDDLLFHYMDEDAKSKIEH